MFHREKIYDHQHRKAYIEKMDRFIKFMYKIQGEYEALTKSRKPVRLEVEGKYYNPRNVYAKDSYKGSYTEEG